MTQSEERTPSTARRYEWLMFVMVLITLFALFFFHCYEKPTVQAVFQGLRPAVVGLIAAAAWHIGQVAIVNGVAVCIFTVSCLLIAKWKVHPAFLVIGSAVAGMIFF